MNDFYFACQIFKSQRPSFARVREIFKYLKIMNIINFELNKIVIESIMEENPIF